MNEYAQIEHENRTGESEPLNLCCPNCGALWTVPTRWGEAPDDPDAQKCQLCGTEGDEV
jgi:hypothetical protein